MAARVGELCGDDEPVALDLSMGLFNTSASFCHLLVLDISGQRLHSEQLNFLTGCTKLEKLDASHCGLTTLPQLWASLVSLVVLFLHHNHFKTWEDVESVLEAPLEWLTFFMSPIACQSSFRSFVLQRKPDILAIDQWAVTDGERVPSAQSSARFAAGGESTLLSVSPPRRRSCEELLAESVEERRTLHRKSAWCSAAVSIQVCWRGCQSRKRTAALRKARAQRIVHVQRVARAFLWRQRMRAYTRDYLAEIDELDLLLSSKEIERINAAKVIARAARSWMSWRLEQRRHRLATGLFLRIAKGFLARRCLMYDVLNLRQWQKLYFPVEHSWEFLVLCNVMRRTHRLEPLPLNHSFESCNVLGVVIAEVDEVQLYNSCLLSVRNYAKHVVLRRYGCRNEHPWGGPLHHVVDTAPPSIDTAYKKLRRYTRVTEVDREAFARSCSRTHPIDACEGGEGSSLLWESFLATDWASVRKPGETVQGFMFEAQRLGGRPRRAPVRTTESHRDATWLSRRMLCYTCPSARFVVDLLALMLDFARSYQVLPLVKPVPVLPEKCVREAAAATMFQATFRAHRARCSLGCGLHTALVFRRAALCIQRVWRWGLLKRRMELLAGAFRNVRAVGTPTLYIEERLFTALNIISGVDRYPPSMKERCLGFGYSYDLDAVVLVRSDLKGLVRPRASRSKASWVKHTMQRDGGLPCWLTAAVGELIGVAPDDGLKPVSGAQGLLTEGVERSEDSIITVEMPSFKLELGESAALSACAGSFRFLELRYRDLQQARQRALMLYMTTCSSQHHNVVPLLPRTMLQDVASCRRILDLWELYGLTWPAGDRAAVFQLKRAAQQEVEVVPLCGRQVHTIGAWQSDGNSRLTRGWIARRQREAAAVRERYAALTRQFDARLQKERRDFKRQVQETDLRLIDSPLVAVDVHVNGTIPPTTSTRVPDNRPIRFTRDIANNARRLIPGVDKDDSSGGFEEMNERGDKRPVPFEKKLMAYFQRSDDERRTEIEAMRSAVNEGAQAAVKKSHDDKYMEVKHKRSERELFQKSELLRRRAELHKEKEETRRQLAEKEAERYRVLETRKLETLRTKALKDDRRNATEVHERFCSAHRLIDAACRRADAEEAREVSAKKLLDQHQRQQEHWSHRTMLLADKVELDVQHRKAQLANLREQMTTLLRLREEMDQEAFQGRRLRVSAWRNLQRVIRTTRQGLEACVECNDGDEEHAYASTLQAFRDLADHVSGEMKAFTQREEEDNVASGNPRDAAPRSLSAGRRPVRAQTIGGTDFALKRILAESAPGEGPAWRVLKPDAQQSMAHSASQFSQLSTLAPSASCKTLSNHSDRTSTSLPPICGAKMRSAGGSLGRSAVL